MSLAPCIEGQSDHVNPYFAVSFYRAAFDKNANPGTYDPNNSNRYGSDKVGKVKGEYKVWNRDNDKTVRDRESYDRVSRTLLRSLMDAACCSS